ncbi:GNAT family N-acetyltransferase [Staphylococcus chromogenes]|uniref:GNAT family N-acetyltransferase n=1 Tax=Staphylococcus chromogenes TaxID=46126 RepID=UPI0021D2EA6E|nr:GNAT family N-acetyltransferase [Staphylococcus chromogenes]MEB7824133.1 GNAT family N-acetyltransferase [Staphylococcus chromogenes]UXS67313.1 GNAT family N-acetyltransferase [Staphylococcus chromogenes]
MFERLKSMMEAPMDLLLLADPSVKRVYRYLEEGMCMLYKEKGEVIGCYVLMKRDDARIELMNIAVCEQYQGKGVGKCLLNHAINYASQHQYQNIIVGTGNSSLNQIAFYQKAGFRLVDITFDFFVQDNEPLIYENGIWCRDMLRFVKKL